jgi:hypothetical protein
MCGAGFKAEEFANLPIVNSKQLTAQTWLSFLWDWRIIGLGQLAKCFANSQKQTANSPSPAIPKKYLCEIWRVAASINGRGWLNEREWNFY